MTKKRNQTYIFIIGALSTFLVAIGCSQITSQPKSDPSELCYTLSDEECVQNSKCIQDYWTCDYIPEGKTFEEVCPHGGSGGCYPGDNSADK